MVITRMIPAASTWPRLKRCNKPMVTRNKIKTMKAIEKSLGAGLSRARRAKTGELSPATTPFTIRDQKGNLAVWVFSMSSKTGGVRNFRIAFNMMITPLITS
jgi:hypothetical protein